MEEEWKDIANFEGLYQVSNLGRVKSLPKVGSGGHNGIILSQSFVPNPNNFPQVNHKDEIKSNNCFTNLEWKREYQ